MNTGSKGNPVQFTTAGWYCLDCNSAHPPWEDCREAEETDMRKRLPVTQELLDNAVLGEWREKLPMTDYDALMKMAAGRELDAEVAKLGGWTMIMEVGSSWMAIPPAGGPRYHELPAFSTSLDAALTLLRDKDMVTLEHHLDDQGHWIWRFELGTYSGRADTAALAVCRAWLAWRREQE